MYIGAWRKCCSALLPVRFPVALKARLIPRLGGDVNDHLAFFIKLALIIVTFTGLLSLIPSTIPKLLPAVLPA
jgi:hypothetical protein